MTPGLGRSPGNGCLLQYSCLENSMERGAWWAVVHRVTKELDMTERPNREVVRDQTVSTLEVMIENSGFIFNIEEVADWF